jgi:hypothetical protein
MEERMLISFMVACIVLQCVAAAPAISGVSGTVADGTTISVSGSGFGAQGPGVLLFDDFEKGTTGSAVATASGSAQVGHWTYSYDTPSPSHSSDFAHGGAKGMKVDFKRTDSGTPHMELHYPDANDLMLSWWQYLPVGKDVPGTNNVDGTNWKLFWIENYQGSGWHSDYVMTFLDNDLGAFLLGGDDTGCTRYGAPSAVYMGSIMDRGVWTRYLLYFKAGTSGKIWAQETNGQGINMLLDASNKVTTCPGETWTSFHLPGYGRDDSNSIVYYDDVYVATGSGARARVEIGDRPTYAGCKNLALATPVTWSDQSITATVRQGSFASGSSAYLYVVDSQNSVNANGYPITIGGSTSPMIPVINSVSGSIIEGSNVTVSGSGFGAKNPAAPIKWDDFNSGTVGATLGAPTVGTAWDLSIVAGTCPRYSDSVLRTDDRMSARINMQAPEYACSFGYNGEGQREWYVSYWRHDLQPESSANYKHMRIYGNDPVHDELPQCSYVELPDSSAVWGCVDENGQTDGLQKWTGQGPKNRWMREEFFVDAGTRGTADGSAKRWLDAQMQDYVRFTAPLLLDGKSGELSAPRIGHFYSTTTPQGLVSYFSEVYIDNTQARIELGDKADWDQCTHREIQVPVSWSSDRITFAANPGSFSQGQTGYIFIVDAQGNASEGSPVTISSTACTPVHPADDSPCDRCISIAELQAFMGRWRAGTAQLSPMMQAILLWKQGC